VPLLTLPQARFLLMSATLGDRVLRAELTRLTGAPTVTVRSDRAAGAAGVRVFRDCRWPSAGKPGWPTAAPVYVVHFTQREAAQARRI
jgi:hypothetical protein